MGIGVPLVAVHPGSYSPRPTLQQPQSNQDEQIVGAVARAPLPQQEAASIKDGVVAVQKAEQSSQETIRSYIASQQRDVKLAKDPLTGHTIVELVDPSTGQVVRSLPPEALLRAARAFTQLAINKEV